MRDVHMCLPPGSESLDPFLHSTLMNVPVHIGSDQTPMAKETTVGPNNAGQRPRASETHRAARFAGLARRV